MSPWERASLALLAAPFEWTLLVNGEPAVTVEGPVRTGAPGWACEVVLEPPRRAPESTDQAGVIRCEGSSGLVVETLALCMTHVGRPADSGASSLVVTHGTTEVAIELGCRSPGLAERTRLQLDPARGAQGHAGVPTTRTPPTPGTWRWQLPPEEAVSGWACADEVSGVVDPTYGYAEYATMSCGAGSTSFTTVVACARSNEAEHTCQAGNLRVAAPGGSLVGRLALCENVGNPGCF